MQSICWRENENCFIKKIFADKILMQSAPVKNGWSENFKFLRAEGLRSPGISNSCVPKGFVAPEFQILA
jgi:hypothetical protein